MKAENIAKIHTIIRDHSGMPGLDAKLDVTSKAPIADFGIDSLDMMEIIMEVEDAFEIETTAFDLNPMINLDQFIELIDQNSGGKL